jgi:hypothetical protein
MMMMIRLGTQCHRLRKSVSDSQRLCSKAMKTALAMVIPLTKVFTPKVIKLYPWRLAENITSSNMRGAGQIKKGKSLLRAQSNQWIYSSRSPRWNVTGRECGYAQDDGDSHED